MKKLMYLTAAVLLIGCSEGVKETKKPPKKPVVPKASAPQFNADSAYLFVQKQVDFGPRVPNSSAHERCAEWLVARLRNSGGPNATKVIQQKFQATAYDNTVLDLTNIIASVNPNSNTRILLAAHWDSRHVAENDTINQNKPIDGANDGGSGVGVLLEIARIIAHKKPTVGVDIILFDGEDYGYPGAQHTNLPDPGDTWCLGSQYWSKNKHVANYYPNYGILLDMVGAKNAKFAKEGGSRAYANPIVEKVWNTAHRIGYSDYFPNRNAEQIIDDHMYVNTIAQIPMIDIIEYSPTSKNGGYFGDYHHTHSDNMDVIDKNTLKAVGQTLLEVIYNE